jgi:hypothetical protein
MGWALFGLAAGVGGQARSGRMPPPILMPRACGPLVQPEPAIQTSLPADRCNEAFDLLPESGGLVQHYEVARRGDGDD